MGIEKARPPVNLETNISAEEVDAKFATRRAVLVVVLAVIFSGCTAFWLLRSRGAWGRDGWFLTPHEPWSLGAWWLPLGVLFIFGGLSAVSAYDRFRRAKTSKEQRTSLRMSVGALMLMSLLWHWSLLGPSTGIVEDVRSGAYNVIASQWSDISTQYLGAAYRIENARDFSRNYATQSQNPSAPAIAHVATHPPGATLFYYACRRLVEGVPALQNALLSGVEAAAGDNRTKLAYEFNDIRVAGARSSGVAASDAAAAPLPVSALATAALAAIAMVGALALSVPAVFLLARDSVAKHSASTCDEEKRIGEARGLFAAALWVLAPTLGLFAPTLDALVACGIAWTLALCSKYLHRAQSENATRKYLPRHSTLMLAGALWALTTYISLGALVIGAVVFLWFAAQKNLRALLPFVGAFVAMWLLIWLIFPLDLPRVWSNAMAAHHLATLQTRSRVGWLWFNGPIFAVFCGGPVVAACVCALWRLRGENNLRALQLALAMLSVLTLISLLGSVRGETERLWMFALPPFCALAASVILPQGTRGRVRALVAAVAFLILLQAAQTLTMAATLAPLVLPL